MGNLIKIWKNKGQIAEGILNNIFKREHVEEIANIRKEICNSCEYIDVIGTKCAVPGTSPCCSECGCSLKLKTRSLSSSCPKGKWRAEVTEQEEDAINKLINK